MATQVSAELRGPFDIAVRRFELPRIGPRDALLRVEMVSICGSDLKLWDGHLRKDICYPIIPGHEVVGFIEEIGDEAAAEYRVRKGDRVTVEPYVSCRRCRYCLTGYYQLCENKTCYGINISSTRPPHIWGAYGEYLYIAPGSKLHAVGADVPAAAACLSSVIGNGIRWVRTKGGVRLGESVVIIGAGAQGLASVIAAVASGADPIVICGLAKDQIRLSFALALGAHHAVNVEETPAVETVREITGGEMADVVIECSGSARAQSAALDLLKPLGRLVAIGLSGGKETPLLLDTLVRRELQIVGGHGQSWDVEPAVKLINSGRLPIEKMVTHVFPLEKAREALDLAYAAPIDCIRVALRP